MTLLFGLRLEASNDSDGARKVYDGLLSLDETNIVGLPSSSCRPYH